jgi:hypothetical protein
MTSHHNALGITLRPPGAAADNPDGADARRAKADESHGPGRRCDMRPTEWHRSNSIVAPTIAVRDQTGTVHLEIPEPACSVSASDNKPGFSWVFGICSPATLLCRRGENAN